MKIFILFFSNTFILKFKNNDGGETTMDRANGTLSKNKTESTAQDCKEALSPVSEDPLIDPAPVLAVDVNNAGDNAGESLPAQDTKPYKAKVLHDYDAQDNDELSLKKGISKFALDNCALIRISSLYFLIYGCSLHHFLE